MGADGNPIGGKWSFDEDNRNKLPKDISIPKFPKIEETNHTKKLKPIIEKDSNVFFPYNNYSNQSNKNGMYVYKMTFSSKSLC